MTGNRKLLLDAIQAFKKDEGVEEGGRRSLTKFLNQPFGASKSTALHLAAKNGNNQVVAELLDQGSDPTLKDRQKKTAYTLCPNKETRNSFRRFQVKVPRFSNFVYNLVQKQKPVGPKKFACYASNHLF